MNPKTNILFITYGPLRAPAYNRARLMAGEISKMGGDVTLLVDRIDSNRLESMPLLSENITVHFVCKRNHLLNTFHRRRLIKLVNPTCVVHLGATLKGFLTLWGLSTRVVAEWDEPRHLTMNKFFIRKWYFLCLRRWMLQRANLNIACAEALMNEGVYDSYIPHGSPVEKMQWDRAEIADGPATYMGNLYPTWDHSLIFKGLLKAAERGYKPHVRIIGGGLELNMWKEFVRHHGLENVEFTGRVADDCEMMEMLSSASVLLYPATDTPINRCRCSTKLFNYASVMRPVLAHDVGEARNTLGGNMIEIPPERDIIEYLERFERSEIAALHLPQPNNTYQNRAGRFLSELNSVFDIR